jgi:putative endonuclease
MNTTRRGLAGESRALEYLENRGQRLIARNYRCRYGEIDLITREPAHLHFVEVKNWRMGEENLEYAIGRTKRRRIIHTAEDFLARNHAFTADEKQFDVIYLKNDGQVVRYLPHAFEGGHS